MTAKFDSNCISVFQHPTQKDKGEERQQPVTGGGRIKKVPELPDSYTNVRPAFFAKKPPSPPQGMGIDVDPAPLRLHLKQECQWLQKVTSTVNINGEVDVTWSAHHASTKRGLPFEASITSLLPLLRDQAHSVATVRHVMDRIKDVVSFLNPGQVPILAADHPIYAMAKKIQWQWPEKYGEDKLVVMFGGLHIEMAALKSVGSLLRDSGWTTALEEAGVASSGTAESFLVAASITKTRQAHQITVCSLNKLMETAYSKYCKENADSSDAILNFET